jgi:dihydrofolate reductase
MISLIAAMSLNRLIGRENQLPWHLPEDLKHFKAVTAGKPVVMGRRTFQSIGRPLPGRENRVVTRQAGYRHAGVIPFFSLEDAIADGTPPNSPEIFVIGGEQIYCQSLPLADRVYLTVIESDFEGDARFPELPPSEFREVSRRAGSAPESKVTPYSFLVYERVR